LFDITNLHLFATEVEQKLSRTDLTETFQTQQLLLTSSESKTKASIWFQVFDKGSCADYIVGDVLQKL